MIIKNILLLLNIFILLLFNTFFEGDVNVTQALPATINPGTEVTFEVTINKADITGFAKYSQELPEGFTATVADVAGGNFTFADKTVKIIWMSLPSDKEFKISYKVSVGAEISGTYPIAGRLSYLENNEKKNFDVAPTEVKVGSGAPAPVVAAAVPAATGDSTAKTAVAATPPTGDSAAMTAAATAAPAASGATGGISCVRNAPSNTPSTEFIVEIVVNRGGAVGFAKLEENIPLGATAAGLETAGSVFSFVDNKVKFLWMALPPADEFKVSYKVTTASDFKGAVPLDGLMSYLENDETRKAKVAPTTTMIGSDAAPVAAAPQSADASKVTADATPTTQPAANTEATPAATPSPKVAKVTSPAATGGIVYRVQICAVHKNVPATYFNENWKIQGEVFPETHEGWFKFTTGGFPAYAAARDMRVELANSGNVNTGPFVTAYNSGNRITVQEALMISGQKWVK